MSRAFVKDSDDSETLDELPEKLISEHPNFVTPEGLAHIEREVDRLQKELGAAEVAGDRSAIAYASRDLRYWSQRLQSAQVQPKPAGKTTVMFGSTVTVKRDDGPHTYRIVGEDEADPRKGTLSYVSPLAHALMGKSVGDVVTVNGGDAEVVKIA